MNSFFPILNWAGLLLLKESCPLHALSGGRAGQPCTVGGVQSSHPEALNEEVLDLLDRCNLAAAWERDAAFCLGLQLGLELGGLGRFWDTEP